MSAGAVFIEIVTVTAQCLFPIAVLFFAGGFIHGIQEYNKRHKN